MKYYFTILMIASLACVCFSQEGISNTTKQELKILIVLSNAGHYGSSDIRTSNHFAETAVPYDEFTKAGYTVDLVSPQGGRVPIGYINTSDELIGKYIHDHDFMDKIKNTNKPSDIKVSDYIAIFYSGGGAAMFGVPYDKSIQKIAKDIYEQNGGVVSAICHGTAGLVDIKTSDGKYLIQGKNVNGFPDLFENKDKEYYKQFPFSIQEAIEKRGGKFVYSEKGWDEYFVIDGRIATGQDPSSASLLARKIIRILEAI